MNKNQGGLQSIVITGSGSGIGAATARRLAKPGTGLVIHARKNEEGCKRIAEEIIIKGAESIISLGDLSDHKYVEDLVDTAVQTFGGLDVLIANAGFPNLRSFNELDRAGGFSDAFLLRQLEHRLRKIESNHPGRG